MGCSITDPAGCLSDLAGNAASQVADSAFDAIAKDFGKAAGSAVDWLWNQISAATAISLGGPTFAKDLGIVTVIAVALSTGLFVLQLVAAVLRRDPGGLARAGRGLLVAFLGSVAAIAVTGILLGAVDALSAGVVQAATGDSIQQLGSAILTATSISAVTNPAAELILALIVIAAVIVVWAAMMIRKLLIIVAAVFAPLAFAGATSDLTASWVRRWIEAMVALIAAKLILVIIFMIGLGVLTSGLGETTGAQPGASQSITQTIIGALLLLMGGFAPWLAIKLVHFGGDHFHQVHGHAQAAMAGAQTVAAAPQKMQSLPARLGAGPSGSGPGSTATSGPTAQTAPVSRPGPTRSDAEATETASSASAPGAAGSEAGAAGAAGGAGGAGAAAGAGAAGAILAAGGAAKEALDRQLTKAEEVSSSNAPPTPSTPPAPEPSKSSPPLPPPASPPPAAP